MLIYSVPCAQHCESCWTSGKDKCDSCVDGYETTEEKTCAPKGKQGGACSRTVYVRNLIHIEQLSYHRQYIVRSSIAKG